MSGEATTAALGINRSVGVPIGQGTDAWAATLRASAILVVLLAMLGGLISSEMLPRYFLFNQDLLVVVLLVALFLWLARSTSFASLHRFALEPQRFTISLMLGLVGIGVGGHFAVMDGYAFSRDEQMALFDAAIFAEGMLAAPVAEPWASVHDALNLTFIPHSFHGEGWASDYRPVNAWLHMLAAKGLGGAYWLNPILTALGLFATWRVSVRLFAESAETQCVAVLLYAASTQVLAASMTSYSMPGHLALNMIWLALFMHNRWYSHVAALAVGFLAVGLHQIVYHPLFAGPILFFCLVVTRRWGWALVYAASYAAILLFWARYMQYPLAELGLTASAVDSDDYILTRIGWALAQFSPEYLFIKAVNLLRFIAWQHVLLLPLFAVGANAAVKSRDPLKIALVAAIVALFVFKLVMRPYQGHGWGYRYMHGVIGIACLVGALGWYELRQRGVISLRQFYSATAVSLLLVTPWLLWQTNQFSGLFRDLDRQIKASGADMVIVEDTAAPFAKDLVINPPFLDERPVRLLASASDTGDMALLCADGRTVALLHGDAFSGIAGAFGFGVTSDSSRMQEFKQSAAAAGCRVLPDIASR